MLFPLTECAFYFWLCYTACRILASQPGIEPMSLALKELSLNHWTIREVLMCLNR